DLPAAPDPNDRSPGWGNRLGGNHPPALDHDDATPWVRGIGRRQRQWPSVERPSLGGSCRSSHDEPGAFGHAVLAPKSHRSSISYPVGKLVFGYLRRAVPRRGYAV